MAGRIPNNFEKRTRRLSIRLYQRTDYQAWRRCFGEMLPKQNRWDYEPLPAEKLTRQTFTKHLQGYREGEKDDLAYFLAIFERRSGQLTGFVVLRHFVRSRIFKSCEIGWALNNRFWGKGYAKEAVNAAIKIAFENLDVWRIEAAIGSRNSRSIALAKKLGFKRIGVSKKHFKLDSGQKDFVLYSCVK